MSYSKNISFPIKPNGFEVSTVAVPPIPQADSEKLSAESFEQGKAEATERFLKEVSVLRNDYASRQEKLLASIDSRVNSVLEELDGRLPSLIVGITERVLGGIELNAQMIENSVKGLLAEFGKDDEQLEVFLCPDDLALLKSMADKDTAPSAESDAEGFASAIAGIFDGIDGDDELLEGYPNVKFHEDPSLERGDCQIKSRYGLLDGRISTKLKRIEEEIRGD